MKTVYVGLSGGVDSSVAAALLKRRSYRVVGVFIQNWTAPVAGVECPWRTDLADAKSVAAALDIPFKVFDFQAQYKQKVVDYMVAEYQAGRTPNPDVMCNQEIKFKLFLEAAKLDGADLIATGHYVRIKDGHLYAGIDRNKDQSYFLYRVDEDALRQSLMPIGDYTKPQVRELAHQFGLPTAAKPDSQGICFVGEVGVKDFLSEYVEATPGPIKRLDGETIGQHDGALFFTIGQRHGLGVGGGKPFYVVDKDIETNTVYVTDDSADLSLRGDEFVMSDLHWIGPEPDFDRTYEVRSRYRAKPIKCRLQWLSTNRVAVTLARPERAIAPGQAAVIYDGDRIVGGGWIESTQASVNIAAKDSGKVI